MEKRIEEWAEGDEEKAENDNNWKKRERKEGWLAGGEAPASRA